MNFSQIESKLGGVIKKVRTAAGINQSELGKLLQVDQAIISRMEKGSQIPSLAQLFVLTNHFEIDPLKFLSGKINYWDVGQRFNASKKIPAYFLENKTSLNFELYCLFEYIEQKKGVNYLIDWLTTVGLFPLTAIHPMDKMPPSLILDLYLDCFNKGHIGQRSLQSFSQVAVGKLESLFPGCSAWDRTDIFSGVSMMLGSLDIYDTFFNYKLEHANSRSLCYSVEAKSLSGDIDFIGSDLELFLIHLRFEVLKSWLAKVWKIEAQDKLRLTESEARFQLELSR